MTSTSNRIKIAWGLIVVLFVTCFTCYFSYMNEPIGDDVCGYFDGALTAYLDDFDDVLGDRVTSIPQICTMLRFTYMHWSGRMPGYVLNYIGKLLPKLLQAILTALLFSMNILLTMKIVYKEWKKTISAPIVYCILFLSMYWYRADTYFTYMWTMVSIYSFAIVLALLYYNLSVIDDKLGKTRNLWMLQFLGFLAGFSHEVLSLCLIVTIGVTYVLDVTRKQKQWHSIFMHTGLGIGYLFCVFAPGNSYRSLQSHDVITVRYLGRLWNSIRMHAYMLIGTLGARCIFLTVLLIAGFALAILVRKRDYEEIQAIVQDTAGFLVAGCASIIIWSMVRRVPAYGMDWWILSVYMILFRIIGTLPENICNRWILKVICPMLLIVAFGALNAKELQSYVHTSYTRRALVKDAVESGAKEVVVPRFGEELPENRYLLSYLNGQEQYDSEAYRAYYGVRLIIQEEE